MNLRSGYPFWLIKHGLPYDYKKLDQSLKTDVVIIGGGISGALTAWYLVKAGVDCVVVDARTIGLGSTCASTALLQYEIDTPLSELQHKVGLKEAVRSYELCVEAIEKLHNISKKIGLNDFELRNSLYYAAFKKDKKFLEDEFRIRKENGFRVRFLEEDQVKDIYGFSAPAAILSETGAQVNAYALTHSLMQNAIRSGLKVFDRTPVTTIDHQKNGVSMVAGNGYTLRAKKVVYAVGYEVVNFISKKIVDLHSTYAVISEQANEGTTFWKDNVLIWNTADPYLYMRNTTDRRILIGGRDEDFSNPVRRDKLIGEKTRQLVKDFNKVFPDIGFKPEFSWTGTFGSTEDGLPFIGNYKKLPNSLFALGFGGNGITFSQVAAEMIRDVIKGKKNKDMDIFSFGRV